MRSYKKLYCLLGISAWLVSSGIAYADTAGHVQFTSGDVKVKDASGRGRAIQKGDAINEGDTIDAAKNASAQIKMEDGGLIAVRPDTTLKIDSFKFKGKEDGTENSFFSLFKGGFRALTGLIGRVNKQNYRVTTPVATIGIRGTDHESFFAPADFPGVLAGAYNMVNTGETSLKTNAGTIYIKPNQMGYAAGPNQIPQLQPVNTNIFTATPPPAKEIKKEEHKAAAGGAGEGEKQQAADTPAEPAEVRTTAVVDNTSKATDNVGAASASTGGVAADTTVIELPTGEVLVPVVMIDPATGTAYNATNQTITSSSGQTATIQNGTYDVLAQAAANAANAAWIAAQTAATSAAAIDGLLAGVTQVSTAPASTAITSASTAISAASPLVTSASALTPADATTAATNATAAQAATTTAATQASAAQTAFTANGSFADAILATPANTAVLNANNTITTANTAVQTAAGGVVTQNTALSAAQTAASSALSSANINLTTANTNLSTASTQNIAIATAQTSATGLVAQANTAVTAAQTASIAAAAAAASAASFQAAGDFTNAAAQMTIAQQQQIIAQQQQAIADSANGTLTSQLAAAQAAQTAAGNAVTAATAAANSAATDASTAQAQATAAQTASTAANAALTSSTTNLATINTNALTVANNYLIAQYNNPAVVAVAGGDASNGGFGHWSLWVNPTPKEERVSENSAQTQANYVLDGNKNLVEIRHSVIDGNGYDYFNPTPPIADANVKISGGVPKDTFKFTDNTGYIGRWQGGSIVVTDALAPTSPVTYALGATSLHWGIYLSPPVNYVQTLIGTATYTLDAATHPTDSFGNVGTLTSATLAANFDAQTVNAGLNFSFVNNPTNPVAPSSKTMAFSASASNIPITGNYYTASPPGRGTLVFGCSGADCDPYGYQGDIAGQFAGANAIHAALSYKVRALQPSGATATTAGGVAPHTDLIMGSAVFSTATAPTSLTGGPFAAYVPSYTEIQIAAPYWGGWEGFLVAPGNMTYTGGGLSSFTQQDFGCCSSQAYSVIGGTTPVTANAISFTTTGIQFGRWSSATALQHSYAEPLGNYGWDNLKTWMYGPAGYLDPGITAPAGQMYGTFSYALDGSTASYDRQSRRSGTLTSASVTANFVANTFSANLALNVGNQFWSASASNVAMSGNQFLASSYPGGASNNLTVSLGAGSPAACPTCYGSLEGGFTGQNYAGAILSYNLWDASNLGGDVSGSAAFVRTGATITNGTPVTVTNYFVADKSGSGANIQQVDTLNSTLYSHVLTPGGVLTSYSWGDSALPAAGYYSTSISCTSCTVTPAANANTGLTTGIYFGTWDAGNITSTWGNSIGSSSPHWITGPEAGPLFLPNALIGTKSFAYDGGMVTNSNGVAGTVLGTTALTIDFTKQTVGINIDLQVPDTSSAMHTWNAQTLPGNEAAISSNSGIGGATFYASTYNYEPAGTGKLTVSVDGTSGNGNGFVSGQLTGAGLTGAIVNYDLNWNPFSPPYFQQVDGVVALSAAASNVATPYTWVMMSAADPNSITKSSSIGFYANNPTRMAFSGSSLTQFDTNWIDNYGMNNTSETIAINTTTPPTLVNTGSDPVTGISWGRWEGGSVNSTDRATGVTTVHPMGASSLHWIAGPTSTGDVTLPVSGTFTYTNTGGTAPTDNSGNVGILNSATLVANFTAQTVNMGVNVSVGGTTLNASATNAPIIQKTAFYASSNDPATSATHLTVTCSANCGASHQGTIVGGFGGAGATGATMTYGLEKIGGAGTQVISGVAAFKR